MCYDFFCLIKPKYETKIIKLYYWYFSDVVPFSTNTGLLSSSFLILTLAKVSTYLRPSRVRNVGGAVAPQDFDGSVNPISTGESRLCQPHYYMPPSQDFQTFLRPCTWYVSAECVVFHNRIQNLAFFQIKLLQMPDTNKKKSYITKVWKIRIVWIIAENVWV